MSKCTYCGCYPFCELIEENTISIELDCNKYIKRKLDDYGEVNKVCEYQTRERDC